MSEERARRVNAFLQIGLGLWLATQRYSTGPGTAGLSEQLTGLVVLGLGLANLRGPHPARDWAVAFTGIWLLFSPLLFWAPASGTYQVDTLAGVLLVTFSVILPVRAEDGGDSIPPGWSYNPASWENRAPIIVIGFIGFFLARSMAAYQLEHVNRLWDPFFGRGTEIILSSEVSKAFPVSDAGLGAATYLIESLSGLVGSERRWRTMPWMVLLFVVMVVPAGIVSVVLVVLQPLSVGTWCTWCLMTALLTVATVPPAIDEVIAMAQFVRRRMRAGAPFWSTFWLGDRVGPRDPGPVSRQKWLDLNIPWNLAGASFVGLWLMAAPDLMGYAGRMADSDRLSGALILTLAVVAMAEVSRPVRFLNIAVGLWVAASGFVLADASALNRNAALVLGLAAIALSYRRGPVHEKHGDWDRMIV